MVKQSESTPSEPALPSADVVAANAAGNPAPSSPLVRGRFQKGQSGNPGGRPRTISELRESARSYTADALAAMVNLLRSSTDDRVKLAAAKEILDRGWGRPTTMVDGGFGSGEATVSFTIDIDRVEQGPAAVGDQTSRVAGAA